MQVMPTGIIFYGICKVQTRRCVAVNGAPVTAVWTPPGRIQVNVCKPCLDEQIRQGRWIVEGARVRGMRQGLADIAVWSPDNELQLVVEIRNRLGSSSEQAERIYSEAMNAPFVSETPFFLLALPDRFHLWQQENTHGAPEPPAFSVEPEFLEPYLKAHSLKTEDICVSESSEFIDEPYTVIEKRFHFQNIVREWLSDIIARPFPEKVLPEFLNKSGLCERIVGGRAEADAFIFPEPYAVIEGENARREGLPLSATPYDFGIKRQSWAEGWEVTDWVLKEQENIPPEIV